MDSERYKGFNSNHIRSISVTLSTMEKDLDEIAYYLNHAPNGITYKVIDDLNDAQKDNVINRIASLKKCIEELAYIVGCQVQIKKLSSIIKGSVSIDWANACELGSRKMKRYGDLDDYVIKILDHYSNKLKSIFGEVDLQDTPEKRTVE